jgi:hypothetical protein
MMCSPASHMSKRRVNWVQVFVQVVLLRARCCWPGRFDALDFERARQAHCRRTTLIVFYLIGAILRGSLGRQP